MALGAMVGYVPTLAPGLLRADSGEFQTLAVTLGYSHPTGYPVYLPMIDKACSPAAERISIYLPVTLKGE